MTHFSKRRLGMMIFVISLLTNHFLFILTPLPGSAAAAATEVAASGSTAPETAPNTANRAPLATALNPDGTLKVNAETGGSYDVSGYRMEMTATGAPRFVQSSCGPPSGHWDTQFNKAEGVDGEVNVLVVSGNVLYVGGLFTVANHVLASNIARYNLTTGTWSKLGSDGNGVNNQVYALAMIGNDLYVGGQFTQANLGGTVVAVNNIARFNTQTNQWSKLGSDGNGVNSSVMALAVIGNDLYVGGGLTQVNLGGAIVAANHIARFNLQTNQWSQLGSDGNGTDGALQTLAVSGSDLYVGGRGRFTQANLGGTQVGVSWIARFSTPTSIWSAIGSGIGNGIGFNIYALLVSGSDLYVGGFFTQANIGGAMVAVNNIARFNTQTNQWSKLGTDGCGMNDTVTALALIGNDLYVGGSFTQANVGGAIVAVNRVARFNLQTNQWSKLGSDGNGMDKDVLTLAVSGSDLYVGGVFAQANVGGTQVAARCIARFNLQTNQWSKLGTDGNGVDFYAYALAVIGSDLYIGGSFAQANLGGTVVAVNNIARFNLTTNTWSKVGSDGNGVSNSIVALGASGGNLYAGGVFTIANLGGAGGGIPSVSLGKFIPPQATTTQLSSSPNPSTDTRNVTFTATIIAGGMPVNDGCVTFKEGNTTLAANVAVNDNGQATFTTVAPFAAGNHTITAFYSGATDFDLSGSSVVQVVTRNQPPVARCKKVTVAAGPNCTAQASIDNGSFDPDNDPITLTQTPAGPYPKGTTLVTLTVRDNAVASQCTATVTVVDTTPPVITCPANLTKVAPLSCPTATSLAVNYPLPTATDNCSGVSVVCSPPSGSVFALGTTTVTCTATDASNNKAACSFAVAVFALALQDDGNPASAVLFNPTTGEYRFCCNGVVLAEGKGTPGAHGCYVAITHNVADRRVLIQADLTARRGLASLQLPVGQLQCLVNDFNMADDNCHCP